jgi:hypothetical protein
MEATGREDRPPGGFGISRFRSRAGSSPVRHYCRRHNLGKRDRIHPRWCRHMLKARAGRKPYFFCFKFERPIISHPKSLESRQIVVKRWLALSPRFCRRAEISKVITIIESTSYSGFANFPSYPPVLNPLEKLGKSPPNSGAAYRKDCANSCILSHMPAVDDLTRVYTCPLAIPKIGELPCFGE